MILINWSLWWSFDYGDEFKRERPRGWPGDLDLILNALNLLPLPQRTGDGDGTTGVEDGGSDVNVYRCRNHLLPFSAFFFLHHHHCGHRVFSQGVEPIGKNIRESRAKEARPS
ncbi:hypothetical protein L6452_44388 [Arctium lappa]|uniref:Uncharacterized protein n=1 Tax=Arctium lappa TaxID=4217 RepID=A0ACB8XFI6_ARCLA|nr:hypothetical protein L6452_44388 [Arctium lappa]